jgi:hypothetical protein
MVTIGLIYVYKYLRLLLKVLILFLVIFSVYFFYQPSISVFGLEIPNPIFENVDELEWWVYLIIYFVTMSFVNILVFVLLSVYYTYQREKTQKKILSLKFIFVNKIVDYLFSRSYEDKTTKEKLYKTIKKLTKDKLHAEAFFAAITRIQETVALDLSEKFKNLLNEANLNGKLNQFLYSFDLGDRILAMKVISYLRIKEYEDRITFYSQSENFALRTEAFAALIRLMDKDHHLVKFIGEKHNLSMLDINVIVNAVLNNFKMDINYISLLSSPLARKVIVGLMLSKYRYRKDSRSLILILNYIGNDDPLLNRLAWDAFLSLVPENEGVDIIIDRFNNEPEDVKLMILQNSHGVKDKRFFDFLNEVIKNESMQVKVEAMKILFNESFSNLSQFLMSDDIEIKMALNEVTDLNIN